LVLNVTSDAAGLLVVSQPSYPGWRAAVNGRRTPIERVDYLLQGVAIGAGSQQVELTYHLPLWPSLVTLGTLAGSTGWLVFLRTARSRPARESRQGFR
jgi:uncharacterized membrane protein YfhO